MRATTLLFGLFLVTAGRMTQSETEPPGTELNGYLVFSDLSKEDASKKAHEMATADFARQVYRIFVIGKRPATSAYDEVLEGTVRGPDDSDCWMHCFGRHSRGTGRLQLDHEASVESEVWARHFQGSRASNPEVVAGESRALMGSRSLRDELSSQHPLPAVTNQVSSARKLRRAPRR